jgi:predicted dehydrogenase
MRELRVAILGAGGMARVHAKHLIQQPGVKVDAVCGRTRGKAAACVEAIGGGVVAAYDDFDKLLAERQPDAVYVCLTPDAHHGQVERAAAAGVHVFLEKPIALTRDRAASIVDAIERGGVVSQVGYHMRFAAPVRRMKRMIDDGTAGRPTLLQGRYFTNALHPGWWRDASRSGGQMLEQAIHLYDLALHLFGPAAGVSAVADNLCHRDVEGYTSEDTSAAVVRFQSGAAASLAVSNCAIPTQWACDFRVVCENVVGDFASIHDATFTTSGGRPAEAFWASGERPAVERVAEEVDCYLAETQNFIAAVRSEAAALAPARDGLLGVELVTAALASARDGGRHVILPATAAPATA